MEYERLVALSLVEGLDFLLVVGGPECRNGEGLRLAPREEADPWVLGSTPTSQEIFLISTGVLPSILFPVSKRDFRMTSFVISSSAFFTSFSSTWG